MILEAHGTTALSAGAQQILALTAEVPLGATYGAAELLEVTNVSLNDGAIAAVGDRAIHKVAYFGDATGNRSYSGLDASWIARVAVLLDSGFDAYQFVDPVIVGDITGNGWLSGLDASDVARKSVGLSAPKIPDLPASNSPTTPVSGADPSLAIPDSLWVAPGATVHSVIAVTDTGEGISAIDLTITYDTSLLDLSDADVTLTGLLSSGWSIVTNVQDGLGQAVISAYSTTPLGAGPGDLLDFAFHGATGASGTSIVSIFGPNTTSQLNEGNIPMTVDDGSIIVDPSAENDAPVAGDDVTGTPQDTPATIDVLANDTDAEDDPLTITVLGSTHGGAAVNDNGTPLDPRDDMIDFTPDPGFGGLAEITYQVNDGELDSNVATVSVTVGSHAGIVGTAGDDLFTFTAGPAVYVITLNGQVWHYDATFIETVSFDGDAGNDLAQLIGTAGNDAVILRPGSARLTHDGKNVDFTFTDVETVEAQTGGGADTAELYGSVGSDRYKAYPDSAYMTGTAYHNQVDGFDQVSAYAGGGLDDRAYLYGSPGSDRYKAYPDRAQMTGIGYGNYAEGFDRAYGYAKGGVNDRAYLYSSAGNDKFWGKPTYAKMRGPGYYNRANGFDRAYGYGNGAGDDRAYLYGSAAAADSFWGKSTYGKMTGPGFYNLAKRFDRVYAFLNAAGADSARVYGSSAADRFQGYGGWAKLFAAAFRHYVKLNSAADDTVHLYYDPGTSIALTPPLSYRFRGHS